MGMNRGWKPQPPKLPGYACQNINPDRQRQTSEQTDEAMRQDMESLKAFIGVKYTLSNPSSNYASPLDAFYTRAGSLPSYLMTIAPANIGPNGTMTLEGFTFTNNSPGAGSVAWSAGVVAYQGVQYAVAAGNTSLRFVFWQKSSPNVFTGHNIAGLNLGVDDFVVQGNVGGAANYVLNFIYFDGRRTLLDGENVALISPNAGSWGTVTLYDSAGSTVVQVNGGTGVGHIDFPGATPVAGRTLVGYIPVVSWVGGATGYLAVYS